MRWLAARAKGFRSWSWPFGRRSPPPDISTPSPSSWLGEAHLLTGRPEAARLLGEQGLHLSSERHERGNEAYALRLLGEAAAHERADGTGEDYQLRALTLAEERGMRPLAAHCHMGLAALQRRTGRPREAADHATAAAALFRELGMSPWQGSVEAESPRPS